MTQFIQRPAIARDPDYRDLDLDFLPHPTTGDVMKKVGVEALKRSIRNLVLTNYYDRPFRGGIGSNAQKLLFNNIEPLTATFLQDAIEEVVRNFEPRVSILSVAVQADPDQNGYVASISFTIKNNSLPVQFSLFLERIR
jgi:phage baseplate assembly protein W